MRPPRWVLYFSIIGMTASCCIHIPPMESRDRSRDVMNGNRRGESRNGLVKERRGRPRRGITPISRRREGVLPRMPGDVAEGGPPESPLSCGNVPKKRRKKQARQESKPCDHPGVPCEIVVPIP